MTCEPGLATSLTEELLRRFAADPRAPLPEAHFDRLARGVFTYQFACNAPYRAWAESQGVRPSSLASWTALPLVPTRAFKKFDLVCGDPSNAALHFRTSGTSVGPGRRGVHHVLDAGLYDASLRAGFAAWVAPGPERLRMLDLVRTDPPTRDSSLAYMAERVAESHCEACSPPLLGEGRGLRTESALVVLRDWSSGNAPVLVFATAFALAALLEAMDAEGLRLTLPSGSRVMETGGFKGRGQELTREELREAVDRALGIPADRVVSEYGMTEMLSQFYDDVLAGGAGEAGILRGPGWVRTRILDPVDLTPVTPGKPGVLAHYDLANLHSVSALLTEDLGVAESGGFRLLGRAEGSELRGCSLAYEDLVDAQSAGRRA